MEFTKTKQKRLNTHDDIYNWLVQSDPSTVNIIVWRKLFNTFVVLYNMTDIYTDDEYAKVMATAFSLGESEPNTYADKLIKVHRLLNRST